MTRHASKRVCFLNSTPFWGGGEEWNLETAMRLHRRGHEVSLIAQPGSPLAERASQAGLDTTVVATTRRSGLDPRVYWRLKRHYTERQVDTVVFNGPADLKAGGLSAVAAGVQRRVYQRGLAKTVRNHILNRFLFRRVLTHVVANSEATKGAILEGMGGVIPQHFVRVAPLGIDLQRFSARKRRPAGNGVVLGNVGRLAPEKGQEALIDVTAALRDRGRNVQLLIAGVGPLDGDLTARASELGVDDCVELVGFVDDVPRFLDSIDIFLFSSLLEGFGLAIVEAGAASKPVVAFDTTSTPELIVDGETGFLVPPGDTALFADRVDELIEDPDLRSAMGHAARRRMEMRYDIEDSVSALEDALWGPTG